MENLEAEDENCCKKTAKITSQESSPDFVPETPELKQSAKKKTNLRIRIQKKLKLSSSLQTPKHVADDTENKKHNDNGRDTGDSREGQGDEVDDRESLIPREKWVSGTPFKTSRQLNILEHLRSPFMSKIPTDRITKRRKSKCSDMDHDDSSESFKRVRLSDLSLSVAEEDGLLLKDSST